VVATRYSTRKQLLLNNVNAIEMVYLHTELLSPASAAASHRLLQDHVDSRIAISSPRTLTRQLLTRTRRDSEAVHGRLWSLAMENWRLGSDVANKILYLQALNTLFDTYTTRFNVGTQLRLQLMVWAMLGVLILIAVTSLGAELGTAAIPAQVGLVAASLLALMLSILVKLDRLGTSRVVSINQSAMRDIQRTLCQAAGMTVNGPHLR